MMEAKSLFFSYTVKNYSDIYSNINNRLFFNNCKYLNNMSKNNIRNYYPFTWDFLDDSGSVITIASQNQGISEEQLNQAINDGLSSISLNGSGLIYTLTVNGKEAGVINIPQDQFLSNVDYDKNTHILTFTFEGIKEPVSVNLEDLVDTYEAGKGIIISNGVVSIDESIFNEYAKITDVNQSLSEKLDKTLYETDKQTFETKEHSSLTYQEKGDYALKSEIPNSLSALTNDMDYATKQDVSNSIVNKADKATTLAGYGITDTKIENGNIVIGDNTITPLLSIPDEYITETELSEKGYQTANDVISAISVKADKTEIPQKLPNPNALSIKYNGVEAFTYDGSSKVGGNFIVNAETVPMSADDTTPISVKLSDINSIIESETSERKQKDDELNEAITNNTENVNIVSLIAEQVNNAFVTLNDKFNLLQNKYDSMVQSNSNKVSDYDGTNTIDDSTSSYIISGDITNTANITAQSVVFNNSSLSNDARMKIVTNDVEINNLNVNGDFPKTNGNSVININNAEYIVFKGMTFDSSNVYNGVEIGLNSTTLPKNILFENCRFTGDFSNNAILVFGTQSNATVTLSNCYFEKVSNVLRLSNKSNANGVIVNIVNCTVDEWETKAAYRGFLICEDYTSKTAEEAIANNLFGDGKITVNFLNLVYNGSKILVNDVAEVCGSQDDKQVIYVYYDKSGSVAYSSDKYPSVTFK